MGEQCQQRCARAQTSREQDEERKFLFRVDRELMEAREKLAVRAFRADRVREEEMAFLCWERDDLEGSFPGVEEEIQSSVDVLPVPEVEESVLESRIY